MINKPMNRLLAYILAAIMIVSTGAFAAKKAAKKLAQEESTPCV